MDNLNNLCQNFTDISICAMAYSNLYNFKLIVLGIMALFSIYFLLYTKNMVVNTTFDYYKQGALKYPSMLFLGFLPLFSLLLRHSIDFETFLIGIIGSYLVMMILGIAGILLFGWKTSVEMVYGAEATSLTEKWKYRRGRND